MLPTSTRKTLSVPSAAKSALTSVPDGAQQSTPTTCAQGTPSVVYSSSRWSDVEHSKCIFAAHPVLHKVMSPSATRAFQGMKCYNAPSIANAPSAQVLLHDERSSTSEYNMYSSKNKSASSDYTNKSTTEKSKTKCTKCCDERFKCTTRRRSRHTKCSRYNNKCRALQGRSAPTAEHSSQEVHQALHVHRSSSGTPSAPGTTPSATSDERYKYTNKRYDEYHKRTEHSRHAKCSEHSSPKYTERSKYCSTSAPSATPRTPAETPGAPAGRTQSAQSVPRAPKSAPGTPSAPTSAALCGYTERSK